jgi:hypothetical protein
MRAIGSLDSLPKAALPGPSVDQYSVQEILAKRPSKQDYALVRIPLKKTEIPCTKILRIDARSGEATGSIPRAFRDE